MFYLLQNDENVPPYAKYSNSSGRLFFFNLNYPATYGQFLGALQLIIDIQSFSS
jgi:hypothetical protein